MKARARVLSIAILASAMAAAGASGSLSSRTEAIVGSPDIVFSGSYLLPASPKVLDRTLDEPLLLLRLWEAYGFGPRYKAYPLSAEGFHVDDPTGIMGDVYPADTAGGDREAHIYLAYGKLNHRLVPPFRGMAVAIFTPLPGGGGAAGEDAGAALRVDMYLRMENRFVGFLARTFFPILRSHVVIRLDSNVKDMGTILGDLSRAPRETAARLGAEDAARLLAILAPE